MAAGKPWSIDEITLALALYFRTPYSRISTRNPDIQALAAQLNRTPGSVSLKLGNLANLDLRVLQSGRKGFANGGFSVEILFCKGFAYNSGFAVVFNHFRCYALALN